MRQIQDPRQVERCLTHYHIREMFDTPDLPFRLYEYAPGEMLNILHPPAEYLKLIVKGEYTIFFDSSLGQRYILEHSDSPTILGDFEFCASDYLSSWQRAETAVYSVELPLLALRSTLMQDTRFLQFLLKSITEKIVRKSTPLREGAFTLEELVLYHLRYEVPAHSITNVSQTAQQLHHSRRQLQRVLQKLTAQGIVRQEKPGHYLLQIHD